MSSFDPAKVSVPASVLRGGLILLVALGGFGALGCRQDMHDQPKLKPYRSSEFFANGSGMRALPAHTVARGSLQEDTHYFTGRMPDGSMATELPMPMTKALLKRGQPLDKFRGIFIRIQLSNRIFIPQPGSCNFPDRRRRWLPGKTYFKISIWARARS